MLALKQPVSDSTLEVLSPYRLLLMYNETLCLNSEVVQLYCTCEVYHRVVFEVSHLSQRIPWPGGGEWKQVFSVSKAVKEELSIKGFGRGPGE